MIRNAILLLITLFFSKTITGQSWAPLGAEWYYNYAQMNFMQGYTKMTVVSDTDVVNGINCSRIRVLDYKYIQPLLFTSPPTYFYTYEDSGRVYANMNGSFQIIQDWNALQGDTVQFRWENIGTITCDSIGYMVIDSTGLETINGINYRVQHIHYFPFDTGTYSEPGRIIEHFGNMRFFFIYRYYCDPNVLVDMYDYDYLECYYEPSMGWVFGPGLADCDYLNNITDVPDWQFFIFPQPANDRCNIVLNNPGSSGMIKFYNISGSLVMEKSLTDSTTEIDLRQLNAGLYFVDVSAGTQIMRKKFVKL
jgi:hypothetical protein